MPYVTTALEFVFGCHHANLGRVFTVGKRSYRVCCDCGAEFGYSLDTMRIVRRESSHSAPCVRHLLRAR